MKSRWLVLASMLSLGLVGACSSQPSPDAPSSRGPGKATTTDQQAPTTPQTPSSQPSTKTSGGSKAAPTDVATPASFEFTFRGVEGRLEIAVDVKDLRLQKFGDYRRLAKASPVTYLAATINNASEDTPVNMYSVVVITPAGEQVQFRSISEQIGEWMQVFANPSSSSDSANYNRGVDLANANQIYLLPGAKGTAFLTSQTPVPRVSRVYVYPSGGLERVEATRAS